MRLHLFLTTLILIFTFILVQLLDVFFKPLLISNTQHFFVVPHATTRAISEALYQEHFIKHPTLFRWMVKLEGRAGDLKPGEYIFTSGMTTQQILNKITRGDYVIYEITFPEGWTVEKIRAALKADPHLIHTTDLLSEEDLKKLLECKEKNLEGLLFPDTYIFSGGTSDRDILQAAYTKGEHILNQLWNERSADLPYHTAYEALIVASIVEREAKLDQERPIIAGVILLRLKDYIPLQMDSIIIYAMGEAYQGKITKADLAIKSPYNAYLYKGLPPTPISSPGLASLEAAFHPVITQDLYFVAKGDGSHVFSATLSLHNKAVRQYILKK